MTSPKNRICPICENDSPFRLKKEKSNYFQCDNCKTLFCDELDNSDMVGGEHEVGRNEQQNHLRISRINKMISSQNKGSVNILDFGCGHGYLINDLKKEGYINATGYDAYNEEFNTLPKRNFFHAATAIEVFEHLSYPFYEIDVIYRSLMPGGGVMIETSFVDVAEQEGVELEDFFYIAPQNGHNTIFSHHGLDLLMALKGFVPKQHFNRHVRLFQKPYK